jgi:hypothetical protein
MMSDFFLSNAGSFFLAIWAAIVAALSIAAFGRDLLPASLRAVPDKPVQQPSRARLSRP